MKTLILATLALATPAASQTMPQTPPQAQATPPAQSSDAVPNTTLSNDPVPSTGPRAQQADQPANNAAAQANTDPAQPAPPPPPAGATVVVQPAPAPAEAMPAPAPLDHYPICKANQFDKCMEPGNHGAARHRRPRRR